MDDDYHNIYYRINDLTGKGIKEIYPFAPILNLFKVANGTNKKKYK